MKKAFVDSSVLFSAVNSPTGGSSKLFTLGNIQLVASPLVLAEVERNVRDKLARHHLERFFMLISKLKIVNQTPNDNAIKVAQRAIVEKDAVILSEAKQAKTDFLVTLDKKHFMTPSVEKFLGGKKVLTPKMLIEEKGLK